MFETDTERAAMLADHGIVARFFPAAGGQIDTTVLFDDPYLRADVGLAAASSREYHATALESDLPNIARGDQVEIPVGGQRFIIQEIRPRQGILDLELDEV